MHGHAGEGAQLLFKEELECGEARDQPNKAAARQATTKGEVSPEAARRDPWAWRDLACAHISRGRASPTLPFMHCGMALLVHLFPL